VFEATTYKIARDYDQNGNLSGYDGSRSAVGWQATTTVSDSLTLVYGLDTMQEKARYSNLPAGVADTRLSGAFVQALWAPSEVLDVSATARVDHNSTFGSFGTGRLALAYRPAEGWTVRAAAASGYRAPSIDERFGDYPDPKYPFVGNPDLVPETSQSFELGVERAFANGGNLSVTAFRLAVDSLVSNDACPAVDPANFDFSCQPGTISTLENLPGRSVRKGLEIGASLPLADRITLGASYTYTDAVGADGTRLKLVPRNDLTLTLDAQVTDVLAVGLSVKHASGRLDGFTSAALADYTVMGASMTYDLADNAQAVLRVENLLDENYQLTSGYATAGRSIYAGLRASF
jgi:vitamin B12 transporter